MKKLLLFLTLIPALKAEDANFMIPGLFTGSAATFIALPSIINKNTRYLNYSTKHALFPIATTIAALHFAQLAEKNMQPKLEKSFSKIADFTVGYAMLPTLFSGALGAAYGIEKTHNMYIYAKDSLKKSSINTIAQKTLNHPVMTSGIKATKIGAYTTVGFGLGHAAYSMYVDSKK